MMKSPHSEAQIAAILKQVEQGTPVRKVCCEHDISNVTFYRWRRNARNEAARARIAASAPNQDASVNQPSPSKAVDSKKPLPSAQVAEEASA